MKAYNSNGREIIIDDAKEITRGGEGKIIKLDNHSVAKIYLPGITPITDSKFKSLVALQNPLFVKPEDLLYDLQKKVIGFSMKMVSADNFPMYSIFAPNFAKRYNINEKFVLNLFNKIRDAVEYAHNQGVIIGDLNPFNILMNEKGEIHFIDVDSYETPGFPHNGRLLDDIRDHLYHGHINKKSDYFAFAVNLFNALTYIHPYKGIHKKIPGLNERMILRKSVLSNDSNLIIPKCYVPLKNQNLLTQFTRIFDGGERFMISLDKNPTTYIAYKPTPVSIKHNVLNITEMLKNEIIFDISASDTMLGIVTEKRIIIFDVASKGYFRHIYEKPNVNNKFKTFVSGNHAYIYDPIECTLKHLDKNTGLFENVINIKMKDILHMRQFNNILVIVKENEIFKLHLDMFMKGNIQMTSEICFGHGFINRNGLMQNVAGNTNIFFEQNNVLNTLKFPFPVKEIIQDKKFGVAMYFKSDKIEYAFFKIRDFDIIFSQRPVNNMRHMAVKDDQFIIVPEDDKLVFLHTIDFSELASFECKLVDTNTQVFSTNAGIVIANIDEMYLLNKK